MLIFNILLALISGGMTFHNANTVLEDCKRPLNEYMVIGAEPGEWPSKVRRGVTVGLDSVNTAASGMVFVDSVSGGQIRTKVVKDFLGGFESPDDLKDKLSKLTGTNFDEPKKIEVKVPTKRVVKNPNIVKTDNSNTNTDLVTPVSNVETQENNEELENSGDNSQKVSKLTYQQTPPDGHSAGEVSVSG